MDSLQGPSQRRSFLGLFIFKTVTLVPCRGMMVLLWH